MSVKYEVYQDAGGVALGNSSKGWRWRAVGSNGQVTGSSNENFHSRSDAIRAVTRFIKNHFPACSIPVEVVDVTQQVKVRGKLRNVVLKRTYVG